jgi:hypothetical protein
MRSITELRDVEDPAWPEIEAAIGRAKVSVAVLPVAQEQGETTLVQLQVTARAALGALALHTGGLLVDHGWLRILGGGEPPLNLSIANGLHEPRDEAPGHMLVAFDVLGGKFALNGGALPASTGEICYFAPDDLDWLPLGMGHGDFIAWCLTGRLAEFATDLRWTGWEAEVATLDLDQGISVYPFPFTVEGRDLNKVSRRPVPIAELLALWDDLAAQIDGVPPDENG